MGRSILLGVGGPPRADPSEGRGALPRAGGAGPSRPAPPRIAGGVWGRCCPAFGLWERAVGQPGGPWPGCGWGRRCLGPGWCPRLPCAAGSQQRGELREAAACRSPVALVTAGRRYYGKEAGALGRAGRSREKVANAGLGSSLSAAAVPGAVRGGVLHRHVPYAVTKLPGFRLPGERSVPWGPAGRNAEGPRLELKLAEKDCSAVPCQPRGKPPSVAGGAQL